MNHKFRLFTALAFVSVLGFLSCATTAKDTGKAADTLSEPIPMDAAVRTGVLPNGLRYYLRENDKPEGRAFLQLFVDAGSVLEKDEERGLAHFVEHMAFNGTSRFPKASLVDFLRSLGMRFGPEVNAYTSFDSTVYGIEVPIVRSGSVRKVDDRALAVLDDWTHAVSFMSDDVDAERAVILEEFRSGLGAMDRVQRKILPVLFAGSPYAERLPIGLTDIIKTASAESLADFYRTWYRPDNMAVVIVGDFDAGALETELSRHFTAESRSEPLVRPRYELPPPKAGRRSVVVATDAELRYGFASLYYKRRPASRGADLSSYRERLVEYLIGDMVDTRFGDAAAKSEAPFTQAGVGSSRYGRSSRFFTLSAVAEPFSMEATMEALLREKESIRRFGFDEAELERAKAGLLSALEAAVAEKDRRESSALAEELGANFLSKEPVPTPEWELETARRELAGLGVKAIAEATKKLFEPDDLTIVVAAPESEAPSLPSEKRILELVEAAAKAKLTRPVPVRAEGALLDVVPVPGTIVAERVEEETGSRTWDLSNGARVILMPTKNRADEVSFAAIARGGVSTATDADAVSANLAANMAANSGLGRFSVSELNRLLAGKRASVSFWISDYIRGLGGSASTKDLQTLFELNYLTFTQPRFDEDAIAAYLDGVRTNLSRRGESPESVFSDAVTKVVTSGHPRLAPLTMERLAEVSVESARRFLVSALNPGDFTFVFAGKVDADSLRPFVETYLASIPGERTGRTWRQLGMERPSASSDTVVRKGMDAKALVFLGWFAPLSFSERGSAVAAALQEYLDIRLTEQIREKLGGVYSISANSAHGAAPRGELMLSVSFACDPERARALAEAAEAEVKAIRDGKIDMGIFEKAIEALRKGRESELQNDGFIAVSTARLDAAYGLPPATLYQRAALYDGLKPADLSAAAARLTEKSRSLVMLMPEEGKR